MSTRLVAFSNFKEHLLAFCDTQYQAIHRRQPDGVHIGGGVRLARAVIEALALQADPVAYLESVRRALVDEKRRIRGTDEDDAYGWTLGGIQTVVNEVEKEAKKLALP